MNLFALCGYIWAAWWLTWIAMAFRSKKTLRREDSFSRLSYVLIAWIALYLIFFPQKVSAIPWLRLPLIPYHPWLGVVGLAITLLGFALTYWARFALAGNWSGHVTIKVGHELVRSGPYRFVRHPIYSGILLAAVGTALAHDQRVSLIALPLLWLSFTIKRLKEEQFMQQTFGDQYEGYRLTTGAIIPLLHSRRPQPLS